MKMPWVCSAIVLAFMLASICDGESVTPDKPPDGLRFTLAEAEAYALQNHPQIASAQLTADAVRQEIREARSAFFPQVYGESTSVYAPYDIKTSSATRLAALGGLNNPTVYSRQSDGVVLNQLITDFGHTYDLTESAKFRASAASDRIAVARAIIVLAVDRAYFDVLRAQAVLRVAQETVKTRQVALDQVSVLVKNQLKSTLDASFDQVALSQARLLLIEARSGVQEAEAAPLNRLGIPGRPALHPCRGAAESRIARFLR